MISKKKSVLLFCLVGFISLVQAQIKFQKTEFDFDTIKFGSNGECDFVYTTAGFEPVIINDCQTGDSGLICTYIPKEPTYRKSYSTISFRYDTRRIGAFTNQAIITYNKQYKIVLTIKGYVKPVPIASIKERFCNLKNVTPEKNTDWKFEITNTGAKPLLITKIEPAGTDMNPVKLPKPVPVNRRFSIRGSIAPKEKAGAFNKHLKIYTNADTIPIVLTISGIYSPLVFASSSIRFTTKKNNPNKIFTIDCANKSNDTIEIFGSDIESGSSQIFIPSEQAFVAADKETILPNETKKVIFTLQTFHNKSLKAIIYSRRINDSVTLNSYFNIKIIK